MDDQINRKIVSGWDTTRIGSPVTETQLPVNKLKVKPYMTNYSISKLTKEN